VAAGSLGAGLAGSHLVRTLTLGSKAFDTPLGVIKVVCFGLVAAAAIGAAVTAAGAALNDGDFVSYATVWPLWWLADAAASLLIAPLIITWGAETPSREVALEAAVAGGLAFAIGFIAFSPAADVYLAASDPASNATTRPYARPVYSYPPPGYASQAAPPASTT